MSLFAAWVINNKVETALVGIIMVLACGLTYQTVRANSATEQRDLAISRLAVATAAVTLLEADTKSRKGAQERAVERGGKANIAAKALVNKVNATKPTPGSCEDIKEALDVYQGK